jgi:hypothetical protein
VPEQTNGASCTVTTAGQVMRIVHGHVKLCGYQDKRKQYSRPEIDPNAKTTVQVSDRFLQRNTVTPALFAPLDRPGLSAPGRPSLILSGTAQSAIAIFPYARHGRR